jgi:resuscitation-promoting factor RpfA
MQTDANERNDMRQRVQLALVIALDLAALTLLAPNWHDVGKTLSAPHERVAQIGADAAVAVVVGALLWCAAVWLGIGLACALGRALPGAFGRLAGRVTAAMLPRAVLRLTAAAAGVAVTVAPVAAHASPARTAQSTVQALPAPIWPNDAARNNPPASPSAAPQAWRSPAAPAIPSSQHDGATSVTVRDGDSLWQIATRSEPATSTPAAIAAAWPRWYAANRVVIGADPDVIHPGQVLRAPGPATTGDQS